MSHYILRYLPFGEHVLLTSICKLRLWALRRREAIKETGISHVVSVLRWPLENDLVAPYKHLQVDVDDDESENLLEFFPTTNRFIDDALKAGGSVLVHWWVFFFFSTPFGLF